MDRAREQSRTVAKRGDTGSLLRYKRSKIVGNLDDVTLYFKRLR